MAVSKNPVEYIQLVRDCPDINFLKAELLGLHAVMIGLYTTLSDVSGMLAAVNPDHDDVRRAAARVMKATADFRWPNRDIPTALRETKLGSADTATSVEAIQRRAELQPTGAADTAALSAAATALILAVAPHLPEGHAAGIADEAIKGNGEYEVAPPAPVEATVDSSPATEPSAPAGGGDF